MKKLVAAFVLAGAAATVLSGTASAAGTQAVGPFRTIGECKKSENQVKKQGHKIVAKCGKGQGGFYFSHKR